MGERVLRVFTHPACASCPAAVRLAWELCAARPHIALRTVGLEDPRGLEEARAAAVTTIPTLVLSDGDVEVARWIGAPSRAALEEALA